MTTKERLENYVRKYREKTGTVAPQDAQTEHAVLEGLGRNVETYGKPICPCVFFASEEEKVNAKEWYCPCKSMKENKECH